MLISRGNTGKDFSSFYLAVDVLSLFCVIGALFLKITLLNVVLFIAAVLFI